MRKKLVIFLFCTANVLFAGHLDSLLKKVQGHKLDSQYVLILTDIAGDYDELGEYDKSISYSVIAKRIADSLHYKFGQQAALNNMGNSYLDRGDVKKALECHLQVLKFREELKHRSGVAYTYLNLGNIYFRIGQDEDALKSYQESIKILYEVGDTIRVATCLSNMGSIHSNKMMVKEAEQYYLKALAIHKRFKNTDGIAETLSNLSVILMDAGKYKEALDYAFQTIDLYGDQGNKLGKAISYSNIGDIYEHMSDLNNAIKYQTVAMQLSLEMQSQYMLLTCYDLLSLAYSKKNDYENAVFYAEKFANVRDSMMSSENSKMIAEMQAKFETGKKEKEIQLLQTDKNIRELQLSRQESSINRQRIVIYSVIGGLLIMTFLIIFILKEYRQKKKIQLGLEKKNLEISIQKNQIEEKSRLITDSIDYAKNIQTAILPPDDKIKTIFPEFFIVFEPKNIVSGDFYWLSEVKDSVLFAAVDCAGEGVPGAFMSIMAYNMLENISLEKKLTDPTLILNELNKTIHEKAKSQKTSASISYDLDISLLAFNPSKNELQFAGTKMPVVIIKDSKLNKFIPEANKTLTIPLQKCDMIYLFTDGVKVDSEFMDVLVSVSRKDLKSQKNIIQQFSKNGSDDVLLFGVKI